MTSGQETGVEDMFSFFEKKYAALEEVNQPIAPEQLAVLKNQLDSEKPGATPQSQFNYAWGLLKSVLRHDQEAGVKILTHLYHSVPSMERESLYYLALGSFKIGEYAKARSYTNKLLGKEPENTQFKALSLAIEDKITQDGVIGIGVAGGILALGVGLIGALARKKR
ncbi:mitochondrial fission 1 protein [Hyphopichia burtonii NRRL Y-1933]|uniref:Mitochondrial fission 1 protein n=1 Tax=Hyphopichia burtonii NRRL Y-1933 TaxID=984485 RepID=A0A1E4RFE7_9ASCO|nr:mitochondrial fission 1 protein [Hyphopichia burtonii NRRL Y-1933]ODV65946.1 mitochondrial fission 1 protein [Hyphopichia burtonii NRRL Y-1933]